MQTLTILFAFAIVAIAIENFTAEFRLVENSDADAKGLPKVQSRAGGPFLFVLRGTTGKEKVTITDGKETKEHLLDKEKVLRAKNSKIIIDFTNDECCIPDRNVIFRTEYTKKISTANNTFPQNYHSKWNCSSCPEKSRQNTRKRMDLLSRADPDDRCWAVRNTTDDFCDNCKILDEGQFCHPGKYTIEFQVENQCKGVTFGGCIIPSEKINGFREADTDQICSERCQSTSLCLFYRYNRQTKNCTFNEDQNRMLYCNIWAGPTEKSGTECANVDNEQFCDYQLEEECDYNGELLYRYQEGEIASPTTCQHECKMDETNCKSWIYHIKESLCILMRDEKKSCNGLGGPKKYTVAQCENINHDN